MLDLIDFSEPCVAASSAQLASKRLLANCVESVITDVSEAEAMSVIQIFWDCGAVQTKNVLSFIVYARSGYDIVSSIQLAFAEDEVSECLIDAQELLDLYL